MLTVGKYVDTKEMYSYSEAEKQCKEDYNGSVVDVGSMEEWDMLMDYIDPFYGERLWIGTGSLIPTEKGPEESTSQYDSRHHAITFTHHVLYFITKVCKYTKFVPV